MFSLRNHNPRKAIVGTHHADVASRKCSVPFLPQFKVSVRIVLEDLLGEMSWLEPLSQCLSRSRKQFV